MSALELVSSVFAFSSPGPVLVQLGPLAIRWYGLLIALAVVLGLWLAGQLAKRRGIDPDLMGDLVVWLIVGAIPMARIYYVIFRWDFYRQNLGEAIAIWHGGIAIHGAILGGTIATLIFAKLKQLQFWQLADILAPCLIMGQAIGRWGNFFNSEAFGVPTDLPWKLYIPPLNRPPGLESYEFFHPTFLYESLWNVGVLVLLLGLFFKWPKAKPGTLICVYAIAYSLGRVWIEGLRIDSLYLGPLRIAQVVSVVLIGLGLLGLAWLYGAKRQLPDVTPPDRAAGQA
ncbi:prolipoprotein diacylglyceryl transferase [Synechococcus sp. PCC 7336]|uniref:prolipoprotein diacylglyceryl transferase n=1 Tax=Synechococcus sp. PCC 7336 TaxID=195250 RepID=UPI000347F539|nr:prolipoprotein diacylglyceryl transferase [Synechococcus sp. PCC 7336]